VDPGDLAQGPRLTRRPGRQCAAAPAAIFLILALTGLLRSTHAGHESAYLPSFFPHEIQLEAIPADAVNRLRSGTLHAIVGIDVFANAPLPPDVAAAESLGGYLIVTADGPRLERAPTALRCTVLERALQVLARRHGSFRFHPYPVTPFHEEFLHHADLVTARITQLLSLGPKGPNPLLRVLGHRTASLVGLPVPKANAPWDVTVEAVDVDELLAAWGWRMNGWQGPPWIKDGWFHALALLRGRLTNPQDRKAVDDAVARLLSEAVQGQARVELERRVVGLLLRGCAAAVAGYLVRREPYNTEFTSGIENVAFDSLAGLGAAVFIRTAKLKDFPWNGVLRLAVSGPASAAWNPIDGFGDPFGRLLWEAVGDGALLRAPYGSGWIQNRVVVLPDSGGILDHVKGWLARLRGGEVLVPHDALLPELGTGQLRPVGWGKTARGRVVYAVRTSAFHDGTVMTPADILYPFVFAFRWGSNDRGDPHVQRATALLRALLAGIRIARIEERTVTVADLTFRWRDPVVEVYLRGSLPPHVAAIAPPWSPIPWHVMYLMEEAVRRGYAAFSREEAGRRRVPWLDLVRDLTLHRRLEALVESFERRATVPEGLGGFVTPQEARLRWQALRRFVHRYGHFLVTAGPYRLVRWSRDGVILAVFRDPTYPVIAGTFDRYAVPRRAHITDVRIEGGMLRVRGEIERIERAQRDVRLVREPLTDDLMRGTRAAQVHLRFVVTDGTGRVVQAGEAPYTGGGVFAAPLRVTGPATLAVAIYQDDNFLHPEVRLLHIDGTR